LKNKSINWDIHTILDLDDISDLDVFLVEDFFLTISLESDNFADLSDGLLLEELSLFLVVGTGSDK